MTSAPPPPERGAEAPQLQIEAAGLSRPATRTSQQPEVTPQTQEEVITQAPGATTQPGLGIDVA